jgi:[acyl-carrier-protein] S-malonyltransferase
VIDIISSIMDRSDSAFVFPGLGPTLFGDSARFMLINRYARELLGVADEALGYSLFERYSAGQADGDYTTATQLAFFVNCLALATYAERELGARPEVLAGPSFGGRCAAAYSRALGVADAVRMTDRWARCVDDYFAREHSDLVTLSFTRTPAAALAEIRGELDGLGEWNELSCHIDEDFFMVSLREGRVEWLEKRIRAAGGISLYTMRPAMHASILTRLRDRVAEEVLGDLPFADPRLPVVRDQDGVVVTTAAGIRMMLLDGFVSTVRWPAVVGALRERGVGTLYVTGVDSLFGRVGCTARNFQVVAVNPRLALRPRPRVPYSAMAVAEPA